MDGTDWTCSRCGAGAFDREELEDGIVRCASCTVRDARDAERRVVAPATTTRTAQQSPLTAHRIASADDVAPALAEVMAAAATDERLTPNARAVLRVLHEAAAARSCVEMTAARWWLMDRAGLGERATRNAVERLKRSGYVRVITREEVTRETLRAWLRQQDAGRPPVLVRLTTVRPETVEPVGGPQRGSTKGVHKGGPKVKGKGAPLTLRAEAGLRSGEQ